jgi:HK97 family phage major capsid protein
MTREELQKLIDESVSKSVKDNVEPLFTKRFTDFQEKLLSGDYHKQPERTPRQKRIQFGRYVRSVAVGKGDLEKAAAFAKRTLEDDFISKALTTAAEAGGAAFVPEDLSTEVIEYLRPLSAVRRLNPTIYPMPNGNLSVPKITGGATAGYRGESTTRKASDVKTGDVKLTHRILDTTVAISKELLLTAAVSVDETLTRDATRGMAQAEDSAFIRGDGTQYTPKGLKNWTLPANVMSGSAATSATDFANILLDVKGVETLLANANIALMEAAYIIAHRTFISLRELLNTNGFPIYPELRTGNVYSATVDGLPKLRGYPVAVTNNIPINLTVSAVNNTTEMYFANMADVVIGEVSAIEVEYSTEASYVDSTGTLVSAFQRGEAVVKLTARHDIGVRHDEAVAYQNKIVY